ncbi:MAG: hypothetical protein NZ553_02370, partial [Caldilinea sp.]|nr:hypothetical protein [Caldilinea sp.]MDW8439296.1 hypothetical protein [Caldilineaceae bacterium]
MQSKKACRSASAAAAASAVKPTQLLFAPLCFTALRCIVRLLKRNRMEQLLWHVLASCVFALFAAPLAWLFIASLQPVG